MSSNRARGRAAEAQAGSLFVEPEAWAIAAASGSTAASPPTRTTAGWPFTARPPLGRAVAELIPGARFDVMEDEAHQPFQEVPEEWNARVDAFWRQLEARA